MHRRTRITTSRISSSAGAKKRWSRLLLHQPTPRMSPSDRSPARHATVGASLRSEASLKYGLPHCLGPQGSRSPVSQASVWNHRRKIVRAGRRTGGFLRASGWGVGACESLLPFDHYSRQKFFGLGTIWVNQGGWDKGRMNWVRTYICWALTGGRRLACGIHCLLSVVPRSYSACLSSLSDCVALSFHNHERA